MTDPGSATPPDFAGRGFQRGRWIVFVGGFALFIVIALGAIAVVISEKQSVEVARQSRYVRDLQSEVFSAVRDAETGQRGYLLTGDPTYLTPFTLAKARIPQLEEKLRSTAVADPARRERLKRIRELAEVKLAELSRTVELHQAGDHEAALKIVRSNQGWDVMERLRAESTAFENAERRTADARRAYQARQREMLTWIIIAALLIAMTLAVVVGLEARRYAAEVDAQNTALRREADQREKAEAQLRQAQKMEAVGQLTGGVAHDFNNMLAIIIGNLDILLRRLPHDDQLRGLATNALTGAEKAANLTKRLLAFSRLQPLAPRPTDVNRCVSDMSEILRRTLGESIAIETILGGGVWRAIIDAPQLESAILNLAINARDAMPNGGRLTIETLNASLDADYAARRGAEAGQYVVVAVTDTGAGMPPEVLDKAFEPFFTTKGVGEGTGLGLSQVHGFLKQSGGHVQIYSEVGVGSSVKLYIPRDRTSVALAEPRLAARPARDNSRFTVLVVEDDAEVRTFATSAARELGFSVLEAESASAALETLGGGAVDLDPAHRRGDARGDRTPARREGVVAAREPAGGLHDRLHPQRDRAQRRARSRHPPAQQAVHARRPGPRIERGPGRDQGRTRPSGLHPSTARIDPVGRTACHKPSFLTKS